MKLDLSNLNFKEGALLLVHKPYGVTSFGIVEQLKKWTKAKIGHAGTLDPLASGLMICCTGTWTKKLHALTGKDKKYIATIQLGATTPTYDLESMPENNKPTEHITTKDIELCLEKFRGALEQLPPIHSAIKQEGVAIYKLARKGVDVVVKPRQVTIYSIEIVSVQVPVITLNIHCSSGTYIRSMAHDIGETLGCGGYLKNLERTHIADYDLKDSYSMQEMISFFGSSMQLRKIEPKI